MGVSHTGPGAPPAPFAPTAADDPAALAGHRIGARLGTSALGRVYLAYAPGGQPVALTVVRPELAAVEGFGALFHRDAQTAGQVHAPALVPVLGSGNEGPRYWISSAYVPALTLRAAVDGTGPLPTRVVLRLVAGLAEALSALHLAGVVHGDLRPEHVLLAADGPKVKDYGLAALPGFAPREGGAAAFPSPEQVAGRPASAATDVFALGQIAAYASIGVAPFGAAPARVQQEEADLSELPGELREIVTRCLIKDPALRPSLAQVTAMCVQAAPAAPSPRPDSWLPPALLPAVAVPGLPAPPGAGGVPAPPLPGGLPGPASGTVAGAPAAAVAGPAQPVPPAGRPQTAPPVPPVPTASPQPPAAVPAPTGASAALPGPPAQGPADRPTPPAAPVAAVGTPPRAPAREEPVERPVVDAPGAAEPAARPAGSQVLPGPTTAVRPPDESVPPSATPAAGAGVGAPQPVRGVQSPGVPPAGAGMPSTVSTAVPGAGVGAPQSEPGAQPPGVGVPAAVGPLAQGQSPAVPGAGAGAPPPSPPGAGVTPADSGPGGRQQVPASSFPAAGVEAATPSVPSVAAPGPAPQGPAAAAGWGPQPGVRPANPQVRRPLPKKRRAGVVGALTGLAFAATAGVLLADGFDGGHHGGPIGVSAPAPSAVAPTPTGTPSPSAPGGSGRPPQPPLRAGDVYPGIRLPAGDALSVQESPPVVRPGPYSGAFGFTERADAFASDIHQGSLAVLGPQQPATFDACSHGTGARGASVPRASVSGGSRVCVHAVDGTVALVTIRQLPSAGDPRPYVTLDVTVWHVTGGSAESDQ